MNLDPTCEQERNIELNFKRIFTDRNEVGAKVMFLLMSVILFTGGLPQCMLGYPREADPPPGSRHPPGAGTPPGSRPSPPRHTVNERPVRILLECILVCVCVC